MSQQRIKEWYEHWDGEVYIAFSGGKDSTVLLDLVRDIYPNIPAVFSDTGLEYPEIRDFVKSVDNVVWVKPKKSFKTVLEEYGYPLVSKRVARFVRDLQNESDKNWNVCNLRRTGYNRLGIYCPSHKLPKKWYFLVDAPFKISEQCCDFIKKEPLNNYSKNTKRYPFIGSLAQESSQREKEYLSRGCNSFNIAKPTSLPISFWTEQDILQYIKQKEIHYSIIYGDIIDINGNLSLTGEQRTGCMFCMFGCHLEKEPNRFQRMKETHPKQYKYCMQNLGLDEVLTYMNIPH